MTSNPLLSTRQAANYLCQSRSLVLRLIAEGQVVGRRIGNRWYVPQWSLDAYVRAEEQAPPPSAAPDFPQRRVGRGGRA